MKTLKTLIQAETGFPPCQQSLYGFKSNNGMPVSDRRRLSELNLPKENFLSLLTPEVDTENGEGTSKDDEQGDFKLNITDQTKDKTYNLNFRRKFYFN